MKRSVLLGFMLLLVSILEAQTEFPQDYFRSPLDIPLNLSGNFGELRTNHFHMGIDIKTQQVEGLKVYAVADGYVSRIKVAPAGYGYALYITHPNGYTSVYGHLKGYSSKIDDYVKSEQYKYETFSIDLFPDSTLLPVKKGEVVALSGNTGGSGGPHLHFELRETATEKTVNPLLFGFQVKDRIPPSVMGVWLVPMNDSTWVAGNRTPKNYSTSGSSGNVALKSGAIPTVYGDIGFAVHTSDLLDGNSNRCGIYRIELFVDGVQVYGQRMDRLDFGTNRAMNAHTIYEKFKKDRSSIHGSYRLPGNPLDIYDNLVNDGVVSFKDGKKHDIEYRILDIEGNKSSIKFQVQAMSAPEAKYTPSDNFIAHWDWEQDNVFEDGRLKIFMPAYTMYEDTYLTISESNTISGANTPTYKVCSPYEPVHNPFSIAINASKIPEKVRTKTVVVRYDPDKDKVVSEGGNYENGWVKAEPHYLGYFALKVDTVAPSISSVSFSNDMRGRSSFTMKISDYLSGIDQIIPKIDGKWALMEYDAKTSRLIYYFDKKYIQPGSHKFELTVIDAVGNTTVYRNNFTY